MSNTPEVDRNIIGWRGKVLYGYMYEIGEAPNMVAYTGRDGAINYGEALELREVPDQLIQESIRVCLKGGNLPLSQLIVKEKPK